jgi:hypothetical protein
MTEKREEQAFIVGRTGMLHHNLQSKGGKGGKQHSPQRAHFEEPNWDSWYTGREAQRRGPLRLRGFPSSKDDRQVGSREGVRL